MAGILPLVLWFIQRNGSVKWSFNWSYFSSLIVGLRNLSTSALTVNTLITVALSERN